MNDTGTILKSEVIRVIEKQIREIHLLGAKGDTIFQLYKIMDEIEKIPVREATWVRDVDGAWKCTHCGYRFFNNTNMFPDYCTICGYHMNRSHKNN